MRNPDRREAFLLDREPPGPPGKFWLNWLQQIPSLMYLVAGIFLIFLYWRRLPRQSVLVCGVLFLLYSIYRFFLVRRSLRGSVLGVRRGGTRQKPPSAPTDPGR